MPGSFGFTGQREDTATGLDYYVARYYDAVAGQFTSADSILPGDGYDPWGLSRYAYVAGNPVARNDPSGHCPFCVGFAVGALVGGVISAGSQVVSSMQKGQSFGDAVKSVDLVEVGKAALIGGLIGGTGGMAGAALGTALAGSSAAVSIAGSVVGRLAIGAGEGAGTQILDNVAHGRTWNDDVGRAALFGAATAGGTIAGTAALRRGVGRIITRNVRSRALGVLDDSLSGTKISNSFRKRAWTRDEVEDTIQRGTARRTADIGVRGVRHPEPATRFTHPSTGRAVTVNNATGRIRQLGDRAFKYDFYDNIAARRGRGWW